MLISKVRLQLIIALVMTSFSSTRANISESIIVNQTIPIHLRCGYLTNPMGIENLEPDLSWQISTIENNWLQSAYQLIVSTSPEMLTEKDCDVWNSGKITGDESICIRYSGPKVKSGQRYYWKVRVWDQKGNPSLWSQPAYWEMGILNHADWTAKWISRLDNDAILDRENIRWIWLPDQDATNVPENTLALFQISFKLKELPKIATIQTVARGNYQLYVNGEFVDGKDKSWQVFERQDIIEYLQTGENTIEVKVTPSSNASFNQSTGRSLPGRYAAFAALLKIEELDGTVKVYPTSSGQWKSKNFNEDDWKTAKVTGELDDPKFGLDPGPLSQSASLFRKEFNVRKKVKKARLYVTALGSYRIFVNGALIGNYVLTPEFTNYNSRIIYQTYDISESITKGDNVIGSLLGDGWYGSPLGWNGEYDLFGISDNMLLAEIHIEYKDGSEAIIITDNSWRADRSPILKSEVYSGEFYDARFEQEGWNTTGFNDSKWSCVRAMDCNYNLLSPQVDNPVEVTQHVKPVEVYKTGDSRWIFDFGQNLAGWVKLKVEGEAGTVVKMRFAEILSSRDSIYVDNLRNATATDSYVLKGTGVEEYVPHFTFHGFRYMELTGYPGELPKDAIEAEVISSIKNVTGRIQTSSPLANKMYSLGIWGQRGNFISVPTDCPQRDERLGYTGDGQVFWRTGTYNFDIAAFAHKWMGDIRDEQTVDGSFPNTAPTVPKSNRKNGAPGWEDAGVIVPWGTWMQYGDKSIIEENWEAMVRYMDFVEGRSKQFIRPGYFLGDHLAPDFSTPSNLLSTGLWAMTADMMSQMAKAIGKDGEAKKYSELKMDIQQAFQNKFISPDGKVGTESQTSYAIALHTGMVPDSLKELVTDNFIEAIEKRDWHVSTGFIGTPYLLFALSNNGRADVAYRLLLNDTYPSWGYMIKNGATTWWERWNSDKGDPSMNSFNHYAFGSVVEWMYRSMAGIDVDPEAPGFKKIKISPTFDRSGVITQVKGEYESVYGKIVSNWIINTDNTATLKVEIPPNTTASINVPGDARIIAQDGDEISNLNKNTVDVGSGMHVFTISL